jgi:hypothetical protein
VLLNGSFSQTVHLILKKIIGKRLFLKYLHLRELGEIPNIQNPKTYNEKTHYRKINDRRQIYVKVSDKYKVRKYVKEKIGGEYLVNLIDVRKNVNLEDVESYDKPCIIKPNNASRTVKVVRDMDDVTSKELENINKQTKNSYGKLKEEWWYEQIKPKVVVENLITDQNGNLPREYKVYCFHKKSGFECIIRTILDRETNKKSAFFDGNWNHIDLTYNKGVQPKVKPNKPANLSEIKSVAKNLSEDFNHARIDLMSTGSSLYFGEITLADTSGFINFDPKCWDYKFGAMWVKSKE